MAGRPYLAARIDSFRNAFRGLASMLREEPNAQLHALATVAVIGAALVLDLPRGDWAWLVAAIAAVWATETLNTALESLADAVHPEPHPLVGRAKDLSAAAVLLTALGAVAIGLLVLAPPLLARLDAWTAR
jgi:diacylglycerol kinase (ATP)